MGFNKTFNQLLARYLMQPTRAPRQSFFDFNRMCDELIPGDVILIEGRNRGSEIIKRITFSPWTHAALYIGPIYQLRSDALRKKLTAAYQGRTEDPVILESIIGQGTKLNPLTNYQQEHIRICRPIGLAHDDAEKIIAKASDRLGDNYNVRRFLDLGRFLLKSKFFPQLWRSSLLESKSKSQSSEEICSTILAEAFASIDFPILPLIQKDESNQQIVLIARNIRLYTPSDFDYSPYFNIVKYPIFKLNFELNGEQLPWDKTRVYNDEFGFTQTPNKQGKSKK